jgi:hypothetical protein
MGVVALAIATIKRCAMPKLVLFADARNTVIMDLWLDVKALAAIASAMEDSTSLKSRWNAIGAGIYSPQILTI